MPFSLRPFRRFLVQCPVTYNARSFPGQGTVWNLSCTGWRLSGNLPMRPEETLSLTVTLPNEQRIEIPEAVVRWSSGQEFAVENLLNGAAHPRLSSALCQTAGAGTSGEHHMSNDRPKRETMSLDEATVSNMWEIVAIVDVLERKGEVLYDG